ncbi:TRAP transporter small permease [Bacillus sp. MRMR6]|uniref:TRAP transporter small permease n=1 Tax=Bacillus sp. MRMR6 TaxID=1928617 RepID=UPI0009522C0A|nr:TRAP transporter small permease [Bacillus sp. MRMR6]OLS39301.1 2,3-diketo-L-gulonate TRAP transporter [Bacillus sp. MRMR6]
MKWLKRIEEAFLGTSIALATLVLFVNIVLRYVFSANTNWAEEFIRYVMIWITFIGCSVCFSRGLHVGIDFFLEFVSKKWNNVIGILVNIVSIILMIFLVRYGTELVKFSMNTGQITPSLQIKMYWVYLGIPVGAALSLIHLVSNVFNQFKNFTTNSIEESKI